MKTTSFKEAKSSWKSMAELRSSTGLYSRMRSFAREEDGNLTVMGVFMFVGIVAMCGVGVDLMLNEKERTRLQNTLDRAVLAAADLDQKGNATSVVESYFDASGLSHALADVSVDQGLNYKTVTASASTSVDPLFIDVLGVDNMMAPAAGAAEERVGNVEISLVVDISGSMGWSAADGGTKLAALKEASDDFLEIVLDPANGGMTTVSVVPYNHTVNLGETFASYMTLDNNHNYSNCVRFSDSSFSSLSISPTSTLDRLSHFDIFNYNWSTSPISGPVCPSDDYAEIKVHSNNESDLSTHVNSLNAGGNTAIDLGMKWGMGLLDDAMAPAISNMIGAGDVPAMAANRPADYDDAETLKIVVLMTDGENTSQWDLPGNVQSGWSNVWVDDRGTSTNSDDRYSVLVRDWSGTSNDRYFWERYRDWSSSYRYRNSIDGGSNARRLTHAELYARHDVYTVDLRFHQRPYYDGYLSWSEYSTYNQRYETIVNGSSANSRLSTICSEARDENVVIYAIAFEAPSNGVTAMSDCASSDSHFFDVEGAELAETFQSIASTINQLRLIQ